MPDTGYDTILVHLDYIKQGVDALGERLDVQNGQIRRHGEAIAVLQERTAEARRAGVAWGGGVGAVVSGALTALWHLWSGGK